MKLSKLRGEMKKNNIHHYIITSNDPHQSEYVADYYRGRAYISGFTGSAGTLVVSLDSAKLWTDGRYFIQAENELKNSGIDLMKMRTSGYPTIEEYLKDVVKDGEVVGTYGQCYAANLYKSLEELSKEKNFILKIDKDLLEDVWLDRPMLPSDKIFIHDVAFAGFSASEKIEQVKDEMNKIKVNDFVLTSLDDIAWLFNIRGNDVKFNPVCLCYAIISLNKTILYIDKEKLTEEVSENLIEQNVTIKSYDHIIDDVKNIKESVFIDLSKLNATIYTSISEDVKIVEGTNITTKLKAIKNKIELQNLKTCQVRDGVAMVKFIKWLKENIGKNIISEISATEKLSALRAEGENSKGDSFGTIAGYKEHAAMMHYFANKSTDYEIKANGLFLVDSGGQYLDGTTDITRTFVMGDITEEEKKDFTLVLKGHINLAKAKFLKGTTGANLDVLARQPIWENGLDYKCGTGHGVGFFLSVHEGPQSINPLNTIAFEKGMILTNEPGIYKEGKHGIRIENTLVVIEDKVNEFGEFYKFETISYCPIDLKGIDKNLLSEDEISWVNDYHKMVYEKLEKYLNSDEREFLEEITTPL